MLDEGLARHAVVARRVLGRHAALVAPVELHPAPGDLLAELLAGQHAVVGARRLAAAQRDGEAAARRGALLRREGGQVGGAQGERLGVGQDLDAHRRLLIRSSGPAPGAGRPQSWGRLPQASPGPTRSRPAPGMPIAGDQRVGGLGAPGAGLVDGDPARRRADHASSTGCMMSQARSTWSPRLNSVMSPSMASTRTVS